ncbi:MAG: polysaccharide pyruvyl transferase family protein [Rhizobiales bacterium]|nr:polysaccharide pyruvyl transferase family protein [Hyphomicrobiales bacterium]
MLTNAIDAHQAELIHAPLRAAMIHTTSYVGHHGCTLVCRRIGELAADNGIQIASWLPLRFDEMRIDWTRYDLLLVNGEGSLHGDRPAAHLIANLARLAERIGRPAYLINSVYENNGRGVAAGVSRYRRIYMRESLSRDRAREAGLSAEIVPDLSLTWRPSCLPARGDGIVVNDSTLGATRHELFELSREIDAAYITINGRPPRLVDFPGRNIGRQARYDLKRILGRLSPPGRRRSAAVNGISVFDAFVEKLASDAAVLVTGRFHGVCLALDLEIPVLALASNTHKIQGLCADVGIESRLFGSVSEIRRLLKASHLRDLRYSPDELKRIRSFRQAALVRAQAMFKSIADDAIGLGRRQH